MKIYNHFINGVYTKPNTGRYFDTENPYTGKIWAQVARGDSYDVDKAVRVAQRAFETEWSDVKATERGKLLTQLALLIS